MIKTGRSRLWGLDLEHIQGEEMAKTEKQLAELMAEEKKLLERQKDEQDELKQKIRVVKK